MKVLFWVPYPTEGASNRYRVEQYLPYLRESGINFSVHPFWSSSAFWVLYKRGNYFRKTHFFLCGILSRILDLLQIFRYDVIFIHREACPMGGAFFENILNWLKKPFIFDFDDAIFLPSSSKSNSFIEKFRKPSNVAEIIRKSRYIIAGNSYLADFASRYNNCISVIPTAIDTDKYYPVGHKKSNNKVVIGWVGSVTTAEFLAMLRGVFIKLSTKFRNIEFKIIGGNFSIHGLNNVISRPWSLDGEINDLRYFDIGIMPMPDNQWTKGKCGFKAILYMSMAIPCICSPVGVNNEIITDGVNGFLADSDEEWIEKLSLLIEDPELRYKIGLEGRKTVEETYSVKKNALKFIEVIQRVYKEAYKNRL